MRFYDEAAEVIGFITPQNINDEMNEANTFFTSLNEDIWSSTASNRFKSAWKTFYSSWLSFYQANSGTWGNLWGSADKLAKAREYRAKVDEWRKAYEKETGEKSTGVTPEVSTPGGFNWKIITYATLGIVGLIGIGYAASSIGGIVKTVKR